MFSLFEAEYKKLKQIEGGYTNNPKDSGGETNYGITKAVAVAHGYNGPMAALPASMAKQIYRESYWDSLRLDDIAALSPSVACELFDTGVNMGIGQAGKFFQRVLNALNNEGKHYADIKVDGKVGSGTVAAFKAFYQRRQGLAEVVMLRALNGLQTAFYIELAERRAKDESFVFGWILNRVI